MDANTRFNLENPKMLIGGGLTGAQSGKVYPSVNPANEAVLAQIPRASRDDMTSAVDAAQAAWPAWAALSVQDRATCLRKLGDELTRHADELLRIEVLDTGNTLSEMRRDVTNAINQLLYFAGLGYEQKGDTIPATSTNLHLTLREPFGVVGRIIPFNHPLLFAVGKMAAPLIAGNAVVLKPSEQSPLTACCLAELCADIFPPGVVNIVTGFGTEAGDALVCDPRVKRIAFTGSVETGLMIQRRAAEHAVKFVTLELGGKNPLVVFPDAEMDTAIDGAISGMNFGWQGQSCGSTSRLFLHADIHDAFLAEMLERVAKLKIGDPMYPDSRIGPMNNAAQLAKTESFVAGALAAGATLLTGGKRPEGAAFAKGYWYEPTIFTQVDPASDLAQNEVFGPVLSVFRWDRLNEAMNVINGVDYGLTGSVWTTNIKTALQTARQIRSGYIWINGVGPHFPATPFGGYANSGVGKEEAFGELLSYSQEKTIHIML